MSVGADPRWVGAPPQIVFEDEHLRVMFQPGGSDLLLLTFGNAGNLADGTRFYADGLVRKFGINCLGFMPRAANWYPAASMQAAARALAYTLAAFDIRMAYGSSLGAFGAIKYARLLGTTHVVGFAPQWSIDPAECTEDSGYKDLFHPGMAGMGITPDDMAGNITVFYDPGQRHDAYHHATLMRLAGSAWAASRLCPWIAARRQCGCGHLYLSRDGRAGHRARRSGPAFATRMFRGPARRARHAPPSCVRAVRHRPTGWNGVADGTAAAGMGNVYRMCGGVRQMQPFIDRTR